MRTATQCKHNCYSHSQHIHTYIYNFNKAPLILDINLPYILNEYVGILNYYTTLNLHEYKSIKNEYTSIKMIL